MTRQDTPTGGIQNVLNRYYYPLYSQVLRNNTSHLPAADISTAGEWMARPPCPAIHRICYWPNSWGAAVRRELDGVPVATQDIRKSPR
ncbi:hypothetical protein GCM10009080_07190 [Cupriavidus pauculus]